MSPIKIESIVSVSSEDPAHPASNLLKSDYSNIKWKCKSPDEKSISVVLRLARPSKITGIDVGNENSAYVEILVARSNDSQDFKPILIPSNLMTLQEAKYGENRNGVRMFKEGSLCSETAAQHWDRVQIVCSQPYNSYVPFGLSFVVFHGTTDEPEVPKTQVTDFGRFQLKDDEEFESTFTPGQLFARRKDLPSTSTNPVVKVVSDSSFKAKLPSAAPFIARATKINPQHSPVADTSPPSLVSDSTRKNEAILGRKPKTPKGNPPKNDKRIAAVAPSTSRRSPPKKLRTAASVQPLAKLPLKPFNRLFENVVFVISGFQNPFRSDLRSKALSMGAKYKADWDNSCSHLVCAFMNTPKFQQVSGRGKIVKKEWIEESYARRRALPWRRFALDPRDHAQPESDEEVCEETAPSSRHNSTSDSDSKDDDRGKRKKTKAKTSRDDASNSRQSIPSTSRQPNDESISVESSPSEAQNKNSVYDMDTEEDDKDYEEPDTNLPKNESTFNGDEDIPDLPAFLSGATFCLLNDIQGDLRKKLRRYIIAHGGEIEEDTSLPNVEYVVSESVKEFNRVKESRPDVFGAKPEWIWRCHDRDKLLPVCLFSL